ncbi:peptidoglycan editing factor PgeF [Cellulomonas sp. HZM]|uniref:peptidoglycan editing factor PgeF n=1 Tax=Cellulomonas sp. HZM TaxID=1454010 RepID=UPI00068B5216|nr:peptidoglycan editing factor PgeF [Cellulomonas sp. HZM]
MIPVASVDLGPGVRAGFTSRAGGVSVPPFDALNLGDHVGDAPAAVTRNRELLARWAGCAVAFAHQVHGREAVVLHAPPSGPLGDADVLVSTSPDVAVAVMVADCVPVLLADARAGVVAAVHAGRAGLVAGVVQSALAAMLDLGADVTRIRAALGPCVAASSYEVPAGLRDEVAAAVPGTGATTSWGTPALDLAAGVVGLLHAAGVEHVVADGRDTWSDPGLFSYRRDGRTGRFVGVVRTARREQHEPGVSRP